MLARLTRAIEWRRGSSTGFSDNIEAQVEGNWRQILVAMKLLQQLAPAVKGGEQRSREGIVRVSGP
jgi:hypothetical protein